MRKLILLIALGLGLWFFWPRTTQIDTVKEPDPSLPALHKLITIGEDSYAYAYFKATSDSITLIPNFSTQLPSADLFSKNACRMGINGGFYSQANRPIGLFVAENQQLSAAQTNKLFNGFIAIFDHVSISTLPPTQARYALQTGPILQDTEVRVLQLASDRLARRMVMAVAGSEAVFMTVYNPRANFLGPRLADLPEIVLAISEQESLNITQAINLDGGDASVFYSPELLLPEGEWVGSVFCVK